MNSEELEQSLRGEFENYLKDVIAAMKGDLAEFQTKIEADLDAHKSRVNDAFQSFSERFNSEHKFDSAFTESVVEHMRLARDEGAKITATAIAQAEELDRQNNTAIDFSKVKEAINDISSKESQSAILKALIQHAADYTPRGAFFILKSDNFAGWKTFGSESDGTESNIKDIHFSTSEDTILAKAVNSLSTVEGAYGTFAGDTAFLEPLDFGRPDRMYAIPLTARGRGVAVLYADYGTNGVSLNTDVLEMLVRVAGLTVEMLAANKAHAAEETPAPSAEAPAYEPQPAPAYETIGSYEPSTAFEPPVTPVPSVSDFSFRESTPTVEETSPAAEAVEETEPAYSNSAFDAPAYSDSSVSSFETVDAYAPAVEPELPVAEEVASSYSSFDPHSIPEVHADDHTDHVVETSAEPVTAFDATPSIAESSYTPTPFDRVVEEPAPAVTHFEAEPTPVAAPSFESPAAEAQVSETPAEPVTAVPARKRLSDRQIDLPVEVEEDERRLHNDARRFARLLVSEIKLYNEQKVTEGRESNDLYQRLKEAIDRSREMYDKRVQPPVAAKFDYFHYELVNSLADGDEMRLGSDYPGGTV